MKNKVRIIGAGLLALVLLLSGCSSPLNDPSSDPGESSGAKLVVQVGGLDARTLAPTDVSSVKYNVTIRKQSSNESVADGENVDFSAAQEYLLEPGQYTVAVWAYTGEYRGVASGQGTISLEAGETKELKITLQPDTAQDVPGTFQYSVTYPESLSYTEATLELKASTPNSDTVTVNFLEGGLKASSLQLPPGKYNLTIKVTSGRKIGSTTTGELKVVEKETVYIYPNLTTSAEYGFTEADFSALVYFTGTAQILVGSELGYIPEKVQISLYNGEVQEDTIAWDADTETYSWELLVPSDAINPGQVSTANFRFTLKTTSGKELVSPWQSANITGIQGVQDISLKASIYQVSTASSVGNRASISGVIGIAGNTDAVEGTEVRLKLVSKPNTNYGVIGSTLTVTGASSDREPDGTLVFIMPKKNVNVSADFFYLTGAGFPEVWGTNSELYTRAVIEAQEEISDGTLRSIGTSLQITNTIGAGTWPITIPAGYVTEPDGTGAIYFKITLTGTGANAPAPFVLDRAAVTYASRLTDPTAQISTLNVALDQVSNLKAEAVNTTSIKLTWDPASWATKGYRVYDTNYTLISGTNSITGTTFTITTGLSAGTQTFFYVVGIRQDNSEGDYTYVGASTKLAQPQNVTATTATGNAFQVQVSWGTVSGAERYEIYRNGELINTVWETSYTDVFYSDVKVDTVYTYQVAAKRYNYTNADSALSTEAQIVFTTTDLVLNQWVSGYIDNPGEVEYYRVTIPATGYYSLQLSDSDTGGGSVDAYLHVYVNGSFVTEIDSNSAQRSFSSGDEVIVAARAYSGYATGSYEIYIYQQW
jgi:hypothetical protein